MTSTLTARIAPQAEAVPFSRVRAIAEIAMKMEHVYPLYFGESNLPTPDFIKRALDKAIRDGFTYYTSNAGLLSLREAIARYYAAKHSVTLDPASDVLVTASGVQALNVSIRCVVDPGDEAIILTPAWPNGATIVTMIGAKAVQIAQPLDGGRFTLDFAAMEAAITPRTKMLLFTSPSNPLGWAATQEEQGQLLEFARKHGLWLIADEVYERLTWNQEIAPSILRIASPEDAVIVVQSFSKAYCMTGWRLGWLAGRADFIKKATQLQEFIVSCPAGFTQKAAESALDWGEDFIAQMRTQLRANRDYCVGMLSKLKGVTIPAAEGAFYLFPKLEGLTDSYAFAENCLQETHVGIAPGVAFGPGGEGSIRICYAADMSVLQPALERLCAYISSTPR